MRDVVPVLPPARDVAQRAVEVVLLAFPRLSPAGRISAINTLIARVESARALLQAVETGTPPIHNARDNLTSLALGFAAIASSRRGLPVVPGSIRSLAEASL